ncbi:MAG: hypothetical protein AAF547_15615 [Actinomycetota bacterium]
MMTGSARSGVIAVIGAVAALSAAVVGLLLGSPTVMAASPVLSLGAVVEARRRRQERWDRQRRRQVVVEVDGLIAALRSGRSLADGCLSLDRTLLGPLVESAMTGVPLQDAANRLVRSSISDDVDLVAVTVAQLATHGGPAVPALQRLRHTLMAGVNARERAEVEASQASASAGLLVVAPALFAGAVAVLDPSAAQLYATEAVGALCVTMAAALSVVGWYWMAWLRRAAVRTVG